MFVLIHEAQSCLGRNGAWPALLFITLENINVVLITALSTKCEVLVFVLLCRCAEFKLGVPSRHGLAPCAPLR